MKRNRKRQNLNRPSSRQASVHGFYTPFGDLDQHLPSPASRNPPADAERKPSAPAVCPDDDETAFQKAMQGVVPLSRADRSRVPTPRPPRERPRFYEQEEWEAYVNLMDLVRGDAPFELSWSDEYVEGAVVGLSPKILKKLREGAFSYQEYKDLHGLVREEAHEEVIRFVKESFARKRRCILIVSGRGLNSKDKQPVLKQGVVKWLTRAPLKRLVLAFASAQPYDGGAGAFYVLLRRNPGKSLFTPRS